MKIFLSWSGNESKELAGIFKEWLPNVLQYVEPYMSSNDIQFGDRWSENIKENLETAVFGLIFVTPSNIDSPWINFEAGALSKTLNSRVIPILFNSDITILNNGPLKQFQSAKDTEKESVLRLLKSINSSNKDAELEENRLLKTFEMWFPLLEEKLNCLKENGETKALKEKEITEPTQEEFLKAIFEKLQIQERKITEIYDKDRQKNISNNMSMKLYNNLIEDLTISLNEIDLFIDRMDFLNTEDKRIILGENSTLLHSRTRIARALENIKKI